MQIASGILSVFVLLMPYSTTTLPQNTHFPSFTLKTVDGEIFDSQSLSGEVALINFWATWCAPCQVEIPWLVEFNNRYGDMGFQIVGVTLDPESRSEISRFQWEFEINYPLVLSDGEIEQQVEGIFGVPATFLIDRDGRIVFTHVGLADKDTLQREIEALVIGAL